MSFFLNLTRGNEIGANSYYLEADGRGVVFDAGMHPKAEGSLALPNLDLLKRRNVDALFLSHAHHDHVGALPLLQDHYPETSVFMSEPTYHLAGPLLHNSVNVMKRQREEKRIVEYPLFTHRDIDDCSTRWQACQLNRRWSIQGFPIDADDPDPHTFQMHHAGHILGSTAIDLTLGRRRILYTGDICLHDQTLMGRAQLPASGIDTLIIETTRGAQPKPDGFSREQSTDNLLQAIREVFDRGGSVLMPIFAMGKTQELLALLHHANRRGLLPYEKLWIGGLGKVFTQIHDRLADIAQRQLPRLQILDDISPEVFDLKESGRFKPQPRHLYLLPSGMMTEHTTSNRVAEKFLTRPEHAVFFVGYSDPDSPAGILRRTPPGESVRLNIDMDDVAVRCPVRHFDFTSHAYREDILEYIGRLQPRLCFLVHGDAPALAWFEAELHRRHPAMRVVIPKPGEQVPLD
ncbi:MAG: MBL fold metallo-hydrolase [Candidatus Methylacidiphilales bacterium]|nr:MBL fold metallo-hydrolase [Candidatus Methylacidiphilales bacterium]